MKRNKKLIFVILVPYFLWIQLGLWKLSIDPEYVIGQWLHLPSDFVMWILIFLWFLISLISVIVTIVRNRRAAETAEEILRTNMIVKLAQVPAHILSFIAGVMLTITLFLALLNAYLLLFELMSIFLTGLLGISGVVKAYKERKIKKGEAIICGILQFAFFLDVFTTVYLYLRVKQKN